MEALLNRVAKLGGAVAATAFVGNNFLFNVEGGYRAVVFDRFKGVLEKPLQEGTSIVIPILQVRT